MLWIMMYSISSKSYTTVVKNVLMFLIFQRGPEDNFPSKADDFDIAVRELKFEMKGKVSWWFLTDLFQ